MHHPWLTLCGRIARIVFLALLLVIVTWATSIALAPLGQ